MTIQYNLVSLGDQENLTAFIDGQMYVASQDHPNWDRLVEGVRNKDVSVAALFDPQEAINQKFHRLTDRVSVRNGQVYFDNEVTDGVLADQIVRFYEAGEDFMPLVNFMEKVATNPQEDSRAHLYEFIKSRNEFTITPDGDLVAYKGVYRTEDNENFEFRSGFQGHAIVDGEEQNGYIYQNVGSVVEMPRGEVTHDPYQSCSAGLHVGTYSYAQAYGKVLLKVVVNPRDAVSVPRGEGQKMRVCRYVVIEADAEKTEAPLYRTSDYANVVGELDEDILYCENCGDDDHEADECPEYDEDDDY
jgi:hypothetical protein